MAPSRKTGRATKQAGSRKRKARAPDRSLFFGGTELVQEDGEFPIHVLSCALPLAHLAALFVSIMWR